MHRIFLEGIIADYQVMQWAGYKRVKIIRCIYKLRSENKGALVYYVN